MNRINSRNYQNAMLHYFTELFPMNISILLTLLIISSNGISQDRTDISLFLKKNRDVLLTEVESTSGNMFKKAGHHGPAIENEWYALRIYFDKKAAIDVYSKSKPGLELKSAQWYPTKAQQQNGWGADYYRVGKTVGLGGIRLWDGKEVISLNPVSKRSVKVYKGKNSSYMEMLSESVPYRGEEVDVLVRITVFSDTRNAKVEASVPGDETVQFVTGINYFENTILEKNERYIATWGVHPEDVAIEHVAVGAALIYNKEDFQDEMDDGKQILLISKPALKIETWITSANEKEPEINTFGKFKESL